MRSRDLRILVVQHDGDKGLGLLEEPLLAAGLELDVRTAGRDALSLDGHAGLVALPGLADPVDETVAVSSTRTVLRDALGRRLPTLGICLGAELLAEAAGARAIACPPEYGYCPVTLSAAGAADPLLGGLPAEFDAFQAHAFAVELPAGATALATSERALQAFRLGERAWGIQFHPEPTAGMVGSWAQTIREQLEAHGMQPAAVAAQARDLEPVWTARAAMIGQGFAAAVHAAP